MKEKEKIPPHEADKLAVELEKDITLLKKFGAKGSFAVLMVSVFLLMVVVLYAFVYLKNNKNTQFIDISSVVGEQNADAAFGWQTKGGKATISGYKTSPATASPQTNPSICPVALVVVSKTALKVGETATLSAPAGWNQGGSFHVTNPAVLSISGNTITAIAAGTSQVYGMDFLVGNAFPCTADAVTVAVGSSAIPTPPAVQAYIGGYHIISNCATRTATVTAVSPVPAEIYYDGLHNYRGPVPGEVRGRGSFSGTSSKQLTRSSDGVYRGSISVSTSHFGAGYAAIFRLTGYSGYAAVSHDYDSQCS